MAAIVGRFQSNTFAREQKSACSTIGSISVPARRCVPVLLYAGPFVPWIRIDVKLFFAPLSMLWLAQQKCTRGRLLHVEHELKAQNCRYFPFNFFGGL